MKHRLPSVPGAALCVAAVLMMALDVTVIAQPPGFAGTWKLDPQRSRITGDAGLAGLIASGAPDRLHVTQPLNGTLIIESEVNEGHVRIYTPRSKSSTPVGQGGSITMTSKWDGRTLVSEGVHESPSGAATAVKQVRETIALSADGGTLTIEVTTSVTAAEKHASTMVYTRTQDVGPCESWPTPCKRPAR
jgi:hypothetical protein